MKWNRFVIRCWMIGVGCWVLPAHVAAQGSTNVVNEESAVYRHRVELRQHRWASLIPNQFVVQNAGNMGILSAGFGWGYARQHWETDLLWGYIPQHQSSRGKLTMTLKENYIPWNLPITEQHNAAPNILKRGWTLSPLTASLYLNTVFGHEFWKSQPNRYPDKYYQFMSTKFRLNIAVGQRITWEIPGNRRKYAKSISLFYEVSSCDLYIRAKFQDSNIPLKEILGLSVGVKLQTL